MKRMALISKAITPVACLILMGIAIPARADNLWSSVFPDTSVSASTMNGFYLTFNGNNYNSIVNLMAVLNGNSPLGVSGTAHSITTYVPDLISTSYINPSGWTLNSCTVAWTLRSDGQPLCTGGTAAYSNGGTFTSLSGGFLTLGLTTDMTLDPAKYYFVQYNNTYQPSNILNHTLGSIYGTAGGTCALGFYDMSTGFAHNPPGPVDPRCPSEVGSITSMYTVLSDTAGLEAPAFYPSFYYAAIKNVSDGYMNMRSGPGTSYSVIKTLPQDWIVSVGSTTDLGAPITANGYNWYQITDPTDGSTGWMAGVNASTTTFYLPFTSNQTALEASSSEVITSSTTRSNIILDAIHHYYLNTDTNSSLYSSDDTSIYSSNNVASNTLSILHSRGFPEKVIWGIAAQETGPFDFDNEIVSYDYGHGIMQPTFNAWYYEDRYSESRATFDRRGAGSNVFTPLCASIGTDAYVDCYTGAGTANTSLKPYKHFQGNSSNPIYKSYSNTLQSIYANIKDGMRVLKDSYSKACDRDANPQTIGSTTYSCLDREIILTTAHYNGTSTYLAAVANKLDNIGTYFPGKDAGDLSDLISKFNEASTHSVYVQLNSPGDLSIQDQKGRMLGVVDGVVKNELPFASYDPNTKSAHIFFPDEDDEYLLYKVVGTAKGKYGLTITETNSKKTIIFKASGIAIVPHEVHTYSIDKKALAEGMNWVTLEVDRTGSGLIDRTIMTKGTLNSEDYNQEATPEELKAFSQGGEEKYSPDTTGKKTEGLPSQAPSSFVPDPLPRGTIIGYPNILNKHD